MKPELLDYEFLKVWAIFPLSFVALCIGLLACHPPPPQLSPHAQTVWKLHEVQKDLDLIRDVAIDANATTPPVLTTDATRTIVTWHKNAITVMHGAAQGWQATVLASLDALATTLPADQYAVIARYVALARAVISEV